MAVAVDLSDLRLLLVDLSAKADGGDEDAAIALNLLAQQCTPEVALAAAGMVAAPSPPPLERTETLGDILSKCLSTPHDSGRDTGDWDAIGAAVELIAEHYGFDEGQVWSVVIDLELEIERDTGWPGLGRMLERPWGFSALGVRVAELILGADGADRPTIHLSYH